MFDLDFYKTEVPEFIIGEAKNRIVEALANGRVRIFKEKEMENAVLKASLAIALLLNNSFVRNRLIISYVKSLYEEEIVNKDREGLKELAKMVGLNIKEDASLYMDVADYLENSPDSVDYSLAYKRISKGWVEVSEHEVKRIIQERIKNILEKLEAKTLVEEEGKYRKVLEELRKIIPRFSKELRSVNLKNVKNPPCIERILERLKKHENLGHYERWALAIYLINLKVPIEEIKELYKNLPDYNEKITTYQLNHIKEKGYKMPSCEKMRGYGLCVGCDTKNPMEWVYERKRKGLDKE